MRRRLKVTKQLSQLRQTRTSPTVSILHVHGREGKPEAMHAQRCNTPPVIFSQSYTRSIRPHLAAYYKLTIVSEC